MNPARLRQEAEKRHGEAIDFCRRLIQAPSDTGDEGACAMVFREELEKLGFDGVTYDAFGNVCGRVVGGAADGTMLLTGHLDQVRVDAHFPGREGPYPFEPYEGHVSDGWIWGRGASDVKGALAAQVYAGAILKSLAPGLTGDVIVAGVAHDEASFPFGIRYLCETTLPELGWSFDSAVTGPATGLDVALGHMGKVELDIHVEGVPRHISRHAEAINPIFQSRTLLDVLEQVIESLPESPVLGREMMAPTIVRTPSRGSSLIPAETIYTINWRFLPGRTKELVADELRQACREAGDRNPQFKCRVEERTLTIRSHRGFERTVSASCAPCLMSESDPFVQRALQALKAAGRPAALTTWPVPTHTGYLGGTLGVPTVGYSPCEYEYNHAPEDRVSVEALLEATVGYAAIAMGIR